MCSDANNKEVTGLFAFRLKIGLCDINRKKCRYTIVDEKKKPNRERFLSTMN